MAQSASFHSPDITYSSTRGQSPICSFEDILLAGLAPDGGLYVPSSLPTFDAAALVRMASMSYQELAFEIIQPFIAGSLNDDELRHLIEEAYSQFRHSAIAPLTQIGHNAFILELFHGPTLAFKDFALQLLGRVMDAVLAKKGERLVVLGATSGDTGSAAIAGCQGRDNMDIVILYPHGRVSDVQRKQMTTVADSNVHCLAVDGTFDHCQHIVKTLFVDTEFRRQVPLGAVNSINWTRIIAQIVYYFYAAFQLGAPSRSVAFSVPTGNFGDIYAGYLAKQMGLPIADLIIASNSNDILTRCFNSGRYEKNPVAKTISPSMDIGVSSNFERLLLDLYDGNTEDVARLMEDLKQSDGFTLSDVALQRLHQHFSAAHVDDAQTSETIHNLHKNTGYLLDPHTAVGVRATEILLKNPEAVYVTLATAHPAKFPDAVEAASSVHPDLPTYLADLHDRPERSTRIDNDSEKVKAFLKSIYSGN